MTHYDVATIGEGQLRLTVPRGDHLTQTRTLGLTAAGSEANVAGLLSQLGRSCAWGSVLPDGPLAERVLTEYRSVGVDLSHVHRTPTGRVALYFLEAGEGPLPARVTYDREATPFRSVDPSMFDWERLLDTRVLFLTGITAALTPETAGLVRYAVEAAEDRGVTVAFDVNHRTLLWSASDAQAALAPILDKVDVLFCSRHDGNLVFGVPGDGAAVSAGLRERFAVEHVVTTDRVAGVHHAGAAGVEEFSVAPVPVIDRPGAGDAFVAGVLHGVLDGDLRAGIGYGLRTASLALTHQGDLTRLSTADLQVELGSDIVR